MSLNRKILVSVTASEWQAFDLFLSYMPNVDEFLNEIGETLDVYNRMLIDEEIGASLDIRKRALLTYPWSLAADDDDKAQKVKEFVKEALKQAPFKKLLEASLTALEIGYSVVEVVWHDPKETGGTWIPKDFVLLKPDRFAFKPDGSPVMIMPLHQELEERYKFVIHRHGLTPENPYGVSVLRRCYWPWRFKRAGWQFWLTTAEKFGVPSILAILDVEGLAPDQIEERAKLVAEGLQSLKVDAAAAVAGIKEIKVVEARDMKGFVELIEMCNRAISKAITGQILATGEAKHGTRAQATVHENILYEIVDSDAKNLSETINRTIIPWIVELNFGKDAPVPQFEFDLAEETPWERVREAVDRGLPVSKKALYSVYGLPQPEDDEDAFISPKLGGMTFADRLEFAEGGPDFFGPRPLRRKFRLIW